MRLRVRTHLSLEEVSLFSPNICSHFPSCVCAADGGDESFGNDDDASWDEKEK
jgi:hypothetical protein